MAGANKLPTVAQKFITMETKTPFKDYSFKYAERQALLKRQSFTSEMKFSKIKLEWLKD